MRALPWIVAALVSGGAFAACATGEEPSTTFGAESGSGGGGGNGDGGAGEGGDESRSANSQSGPGPGSVTSVVSTSGPGPSASSGGVTATSGSSTASGDPSSSSGAGGAPCQDQGPGEPGNDTKAGAYDLGTIGDSDGDGGQVTGNLREPGDVDWYTYAGEDNLGSSVDPFRQVAGPGLRVCMFVECIEGDTEFDCPSDTLATSEGGIPGCCWNGTQEVNIGGFNCNGPISDDANVYMKIEHPDGPGCESYTINYHY